MPSANEFNVSNTVRVVTVVSPGGFDTFDTSVQSLDLLGHGEGVTDIFSRDLLPEFSAGGQGEQFWHGQGCPLFDVVQPALMNTNNSL